jgi:hypothetical protein
VACEKNAHAGRATEEPPTFRCLALWPSTVWSGAVQFTLCCTWEMRGQAEMCVWLAHGLGIRW